MLSFKNHQFNKKTTCDDFENIACRRIYTEFPAVGKARIFGQILPIFRQISAKFGLTYQARKFVYVYRIYDTYMFNSPSQKFSVLMS